MKLCPAFGGSTLAICALLAAACGPDDASGSNDPGGGDAVDNGDNGEADPADGGGADPANPNVREMPLISVGGMHSCMLGKDGDLSCWGGNAMGQATAPQGKFVAFNSGMMHACALDAAGKATCWGSNGMTA